MCKRPWAKRFVAPRYMTIFDVIDLKAKWQTKSKKEDEA